jgi:hypothetical protein
MTPAALDELGTDAQNDDSRRSRNEPSHAWPTPLHSAAPNETRKFSSADFERHVEDAAALLDHAVNAGIDVEGTVRRDVIAAEAAVKDGWSEEQYDKLLVALTSLAAKVRPVSAESLRKCRVNQDAARTITRYRLIGILLGLLVVPYSVVAFVASSTCESIRKDIDAANAVAVVVGARLSVAISPNGDKQLSGATQISARDLRDLQQMAAAIRDIVGRARRLHHLSLYGEVADVNLQSFQLPPQITVQKDAETNVIRSYQAARDYAQNVQENVSVSFGAITTCVLPMLYSLLGACASLTRLFEGQIKSHTFTGAHRSTGRFLVAGIGGIVVGLFSNFVVNHDALSPLAIGFLVGYGGDTFFNFLDMLLQYFARPTDESSPVPTLASARKG